MRAIDKGQSAQLLSEFCMFWKQVFSTHLMYFLRFLFSPTIVHNFVTMCTVVNFAWTASSSLWLKVRTLWKFLGQLLV